MILAGDVLFFKITGKKTPLKTLQKTFEGKYGHVEIIHSINPNGTLKCLGSRSNGVSFKDIKVTKDNDIGRFPILINSSEMIKLIEEYFESLPNKNYDYLGWIDTTINITFSVFSFGKWRKRSIFKTKGDPKICSELVSELINKAMKEKIFNNDITAPSEISRNKHCRIILQGEKLEKIK